MDIEQVATIIVDCAYTVHKTLGPGLLESAYQAALSYDLVQRGLKVQNELALPIAYKGIKIDAGYRLDMLVESMIIVENKTVDRLMPVHKAQLLTYLKLSNLKIGFLINWNSVLIKNGLMRMVYHYNDRPKNALRT
ncbi:MAG: GxxExxY protein [Anaerolineaceae bacterium]|nr:GxxExxY protein [Anaerolineaceae bacterium]MBN2678512.1 GxxExxY protein [Anaerolineaceae bacterium]